MAHASITSKEICSWSYIRPGTCVSDPSLRPCYIPALQSVLTTSMPKHHRHLRSPHQTRVRPRPRRPNVRLCAEVATLKSRNSTGYHRCLFAGAGTGHTKNLPNIDFLVDGRWTRLCLGVLWVLEDNSVVECTDRGSRNTAGHCDTASYGQKVECAGSRTDQNHFGLGDSFGKELGEAWIGSLYAVGSLLLYLALRNADMILNEFQRFLCW